MNVESFSSRWVVRPQPEGRVSPSRSRGKSPSTRTPGRWRQVPSPCPGDPVWLPTKPAAWASSSLYRRPEEAAEMWLRGGSCQAGCSSDS